MNVVKIKNIEINFWKDFLKRAISSFIFPFLEIFSKDNNNKIYINNFEETIKDLNKEFHQIRIKKKKEKRKFSRNFKFKSPIRNFKKRLSKINRF